MSRSSPPTIRRRRLAMELRRLREQAGLTLEQVGDHQETKKARMSKVELGTLGIKPAEVRELLDLYEVADVAYRAALINLARHAGERGWWVGYREVMAPRFDSYVELEGDATLIRRYAVQHVPGLLQTREYAWALSAAGSPDAPATRIDRWVALRMDRQKVLAKDTPPRLEVVVDECVLRNRVGGPGIMHRQLGHLAAQAAAPNITIQVLPSAESEARARTHGAFTILEYQETVGLDVVYVELLADSLFIEDQGRIDRYKESFAHLVSEALSPAQSAERMRQLAEEIWPTTNPSGGAP